MKKIQMKLKCIDLQALYSDQSSFLLAGTLKQHLSSQEDRILTEAAEIKDGLYVDDLLT